MAVLAHKLVQAEYADFDTIFLDHYDRVYGILYRLVGNRGEAEDLAQEVFFKLYQQPPRQRDTNISAWLYRVATNHGYNALRSRKRRWQRDTHLLQTGVGRDPHDEVVNREEVAAVREALAQLKPAQGQLLLLRQMGLSYAELAETCGIHPNSVGKQLSRASQAFRTAYLRGFKHV